VGEGSRVFISYAGVDRPWAEWARWHLRHAGIDTELDCAGRAGDNFVERMDAALARPIPMLALLSASYLEPSGFTMDQWTARFAQRRRNPETKLIPVRIDGVDLDAGIWAPIVVPDLSGLDSDAAVQLLLTSVREALAPSTASAAPGAEPGYPDAPKPSGGVIDRGPRPPGFLPPVWNVDRRNPAFTGRDDILNQVHEQLSDNRLVAVRAVHGLGGVGKTQLAIEYAYRFSGEYDLVWWISAELGSIGEQVAALGVNLGIIDAEADSTLAKSKVMDHLAGQQRSLLIFDNVLDGRDIVPWLPRGKGHVLITSRQGNWQGIAHAVELDVLSREEAVRFLTEQRSGLAATEAGQLAEALGDLPLALAQAAGYLSETGMPVADYRQLLVDETRAVLDLGKPIDYPQSFAAAITLSTAALSDADPAAGAILRLCGLLAPEPIPVDVIVELARPRNPYPRVLEPLREVIGKPMTRQEAIRRIGAYSLARLGLGTVTVHRLTQAVVRSQMESKASAELSAHLETIIGRMNPGDPVDPANWPAWARLLPHLLTVGAAGTADADLRLCARDAVVYLINRGDAGPARQLAEDLYREWKQRLGPDHPDTLRAATELAWALRNLGDYSRLLPLVEDTLARQSGRLPQGPDHPEALRSASDLALVHGALGHHREALDRQEQVWERRRRVLGEEHPDTLTSADNMAGSLRELGRHREALELQRQVWKQRRRVLGEEHPDTLTSADHMAGSLRELERSEEALDLHEQVWGQCRRVLGEEHPSTLTVASSVAATLDALGRHGEALDLQRQVWDRRRRVLGEEHPDTLAAANNVAGSLRDLGRSREALELRKKVWEQCLRVLGEDHPNTLKAAVNLSISMLDLGKTLPARRQVEPAWKGLRDQFGPQHPDTRWAAEVRQEAVQLMGGTVGNRKQRRRR
jgi:tetratricopeptide (TPR) repeat protein